MEIYQFQHELQLLNGTDTEIKPSSYKCNGTVWKMLNGNEQMNMQTIQMKKKKKEMKICHLRSKIGT